jgi:hypothetical protein
MARSHARFWTSIWSDRHFKSLSSEAQWLYFLLVTQPDLNHAGFLPLTVRRWARLSADQDEGLVRSALGELAAMRYVVVDYDTEEVLIRTFIRNDQVYKQPKVLAVALVEAGRLASYALRCALADELERLPLEELPGKTRGEVTALLAGRADALREGGADPLPDPPAQGPREGDAEGARGQGNGYGLYEVASPIPGAPADPPPAGAAAPSEPITARTIVGEWLDRCAKRPPKNVVGQLSKQIKSLLDEGIDPDDVRRGVALWMTKDVHPSVLPSLVNTAMNAAPAARSSPPLRVVPSTTDQRVAAAQALKAKFASQPPLTIAGEITP